MYATIMILMTVIIPVTARRFSMLIDVPEMMGSRMFSKVVLLYVF